MTVIDRLYLREIRNGREIERERKIGKRMIEKEECERDKENERKKMEKIGR